MLLKEKKLIENNLDIVLHCAKFLDSKKANRTIILDVSKLTPVCDYFVISSVDNFIALNVLADYVDEEMEKINLKRINPKNQFDETPWILLDYGFMVVHLFLNEAREYYNIEKFWHDANIIYNSNYQ